VVGEDGVENIVDEPRLSCEGTRVVGAEESG
jgi:hypothetical protein